MLIHCATARLEGNTPHSLESLLKETFDWAYLLRMAFQHKMLPLLYHHVCALPTGTVPESPFKQLQQYYLSNSFRNLHLTHELIRLLEGLQSEGIHAVPFKGPVLAALAYDNLSLRTLYDLDLLLPFAQIFRAKEWMISQGFRPQEEMTKAEEDRHLRRHCEYNFERDTDGLIVEAHWKIRPDFFSFRLPPEVLWGRLKTTVLAGQEIPTLSVEDLILILCVHGSGDRWNRLELIGCLGDLIRRSPEVDWEILLESSRSTGSERMLFLGLLLARTVSDPPLPADLVRRMESDSAVQVLKARVAARLFQEKETSAREFEKWSFYLRMRERFQDRSVYLRYLMGRVFIPTELDRQQYPLPSHLEFLYPLLRPVRLFHHWHLSQKERKT